jgi:23S rRNA (cytidine1920-2'-O)/16S rRNA (cytidine1409-2'-O)-methyltransferase
MAKGQRLDVWLHTNGLFPSREAARRAVMAGLVRVDGSMADKPGFMVKPDARDEVAAPLHPYVGRGGLKLQLALEQFPVSLQDRIVVDVGASTGGFTDCALQHGAKTVYAVDVGYGQLDWKLRTDPRVVVMERTNFRHIDGTAFDPRPECGVMDVSFISTKLLLPVLMDVLCEPGDIISLIKPQFEAGRDRVGKGGIVRDPHVHLQVILDVMSFVRSLGLYCGGLDYSPISGGDGNIEFLAWWTRIEQVPGQSFYWEERAKAVVESAWQSLQHTTVVWNE